MPDISVRGDGFHLELSVAGYERERRGEAYDDNWLRGGVSLTLAQPPTATFTGTTPRLINVSVLKYLGGGFTIGFVVDGPTPFPTANPAKKPTR